MKRSPVPVALTAMPPANSGRRQRTTRGGAEAVVGRDKEFAAVVLALEAEHQSAVHVHGIPGIGKSALLQALVTRLRAHGHVVAALDCRAIEPTGRGLLRALGEAGLSNAGRRRPREIVVLDNYEHLQLLDSWIRDELLPRHRELRLLLASRRLPHPAWITSGATFLSVRLDELGRDASLQVLQASGLSKAAARRAYVFTRGHPMALRLAISSGRKFSHNVPDDLTRHQVIAQLSDTFLADLNLTTRRALEAISTVRRTTQSMLAAMLEIPEASLIYGDIQQLSFVERRADGLALHPTVQEVIANQLRASDPVLFTSYRRRAWRALEILAPAISATDLWRYTADVLYLIDNPVVREAFFPSQAAHLAVERARADDEGVVLDIAEKHDGAMGRAVIEGWWKVLPSAFHVVRDSSQKVVGFYCMFDPASAPSGQVTSDPLTRAWRQHLPMHLCEPQRVLFLRRWLAREGGEGPSAVQAACWLDVKRAYVEMRPFLQRVYLGVANLAPFAPAASELGFEVVCADSCLPLVSAVLDFGPGSVDAWLRHLVRKELRIPDSAAIDITKREAVIAGRRILLAPLECGVLSALIKAEGSILSRDQLMQQVWGEKQYEVGSNVLEVVMLSLRRKLGEHAKAVVTVRGLGYRYCDLPRLR